MAPTLLIHGKDETSTEEREALLELIMEELAGLSPDLPFPEEDTVIKKTEPYSPSSSGVLPQPRTLQQMQAEVEAYERGERNSTHVGSVFPEPIHPLEPAIREWMKKEKIATFATAEMHAVELTAYLKQKGNRSSTGAPYVYEEVIRVVRLLRNRTTSR